MGPTRLGGVRLLRVAPAAVEKPLPSRAAVLVHRWDRFGRQLRPTPDALVLIGYHGMAGTKKAILDHTWSTRVRAAFLDDRPGDSSCARSSL